MWCALSLREIQTAEIHSWRRLPSGWKTAAEKHSHEMFNNTWLKLTWQEAWNHILSTFSTLYQNKFSTGLALETELWITKHQIHLQCPIFSDEPLIYHIPNTSPVSYLLRWTSDLPHTKYISSVLSSQMNLWFTTYPIHLQCPIFSDEPLIYHIPNTSPVSYLLRWTSDLPHTQYISSVLSSQMNLWFTTYQIHLQCPTFLDEPLIYHIPNTSPVFYLLRWTSDLPHTKYISSVLPS